MRKFMIKRGLSGLGLVATAEIKRGERIVEYVGERIDDAEADRRTSRYIFEVTKDLNIDGKSRKNLARYVNHSCRPNCSYRIIGTRVYYHAKRAIHPGEELTVDYGQDYFDFYIKAFGCRCGAAHHRGQGKNGRKNP